MEQHPHHHHHHSPPVGRRITNAFMAGIVLNLLFVMVEVTSGLYTHSLSLLTDAGHNLGDVGSLALALLADRLARKKASERFSFGYRQGTVLVAFVNGAILLLAMGAIAYEAVLRFNNPQPLQGGIVAVVAGIGIIVNGATALLFFKDKEHDLNVKGAYLHMISDALVSLGVVASGIAIIYTGWYWLDSLLSLVLVVVIAAGSWGLFRESLRLTLNGVPAGISLSAVKDYFLNLEGVLSVHDLHVWAISTTETGLTVHLVVKEGLETSALYAKVKEDLFHTFRIGHSTLQLEKGDPPFHCEQKC